MDTSYLELRCKEIVNVVDGRKLGHIVDVLFNLESGCLLGVVVPGDKSFWQCFKGGTELFIPLSQIVKVGEDTVLVELFGNQCPNPPYITSSSTDKKKK
jgi:YlmC/YmxH family sporulation protein